MKRRKATWSLKGLHAGEIIDWKTLCTFFFGVKFWTQGQEAIGWPALCCPGNPDGVQQVKYTKPKRIKAVTPKYYSFPSFKVPLNPFVLTFQIFDLDPEVNQHSSRNRWIWGCPWYRGRWRTLASNWGAWDVLWKMPTKWGSHSLWKIFYSVCKTVVWKWAAIVICESWNIRFLNVQKLLWNQVWKLNRTEM